MLEELAWSGALQPSPDPQITREPTSVQHPEPAPRMRLWVMDAWVRQGAVLTDRERVRTIMYEAAALGGVRVLGEKFCVFDNAAITGVLVLAQSHLSIHTWPELALANIDLLSYGDVAGEDVVRSIGKGLGARRVEISCLRRALP